MSTMFRRVLRVLLALVGLGVAGVAAIALLTIPLMLRLPRPSRVSMDGITTIEDAVDACWRTHLRGWDLVAYAQNLVARKFTYSRLNTWDSPSRAFERGMGYCDQQALALKEVYDRLGITSRAVFAFRCRFPAAVVDGMPWSGGIMSHAWLRVRIGNEECDVCPQSANNRPGVTSFEILSPVHTSHSWLRPFTRLESSIENIGRDMLARRKTSLIQRLSSTVADPSALAYIAGVMIVEAGPLLDADRQLRLGEIRSRLECCLSRLPQLRRRAYFPGPFQGRPVWIDDATFAIERHIRTGPVESPGSEDEVLRVAERILRNRLDLSRPPWELWFLTGLPAGRLAVLLKLHHAIADGLGAVQVMMTLFDLGPEAPDLPLVPWTPAPPPSQRALLADNLAAKVAGLARALSALRHPGRLADAASNLWRTITMSFQSPKTSFNRPVPDGSNNQVRVIHLDLEPARVAAHAVGATVNDVLLDIAAGGLRELLIGRDDQVKDLHLFAMVPVTLRSSVKARALGNQAGFMVVPLPVGEPDGRRRLQLIQAAAQHAKAEQRSTYSQALGTLSVMSAKVAPTFMAHQRFINLIATNVPGPTVPLYLLGARILDVIPLVGGLLGGNVTVCFCAFSYVGKLNLTVIADATVVPDVDLVLRGMERTWRHLIREAMPSV